MNNRLREGGGGTTLPRASLSAAKIFAFTEALLAFGERYFAVDQSGRLIPKVPNRRVRFTLRLEAW
jgi:hypothetical protein